MLTIFSCPKAFEGHIDIIQRNAIGSWIELVTNSNVILIGDDHGIEEVCAEFNIKHIQNVKKNDYGTPLMSSIFEIGQRVGSQKLSCYINSDIILMGGFIDAIKRVADDFEKFLTVGRRWDLDIVDAISFDDGKWVDRLKGEIRSKGILHKPAGIDCFVFPPWTIGIVSRFRIGPTALG